MTYIDIWHTTSIHEPPSSYLVKSTSWQYQKRRFTWNKIWRKDNFHGIHVKIWYLHELHCASQSSRDNGSSFGVLIWRHECVTSSVCVHVISLHHLIDRFIPISYIVISIALFIVIPLYQRCKDEFYTHDTWNNAVHEFHENL